MLVRIAGLMALAAVAVLILMTGSAPRSAQAQIVAPKSSPLPPPPHMFSPWYGESLRGILDLEGAQSAQLELRLAANPGDFPTRLKLMAYHQRADRAAHQEDRSKRVQHALWLIEHHPESELLHSPVSRFSPGELSSTDYRRAVALWEAAAKRQRAEAVVQWNAASFFEGLDLGLHMHYLEEGPRASRSTAIKNGRADDAHVGQRPTNLQSRHRRIR